MIAFARRHRVALGVVFVATVVLVLFVFAFSWAAPEMANESWGWMMLFGALPWSLLAQAVPWSVAGIAILALGLGVNAALVALVAGYAGAWWWRTLRAEKP
jgi:hypothetical protein